MASISAASMPATPTLPNPWGNSWEGSWQDTETGLAMKGFGVEVWVMRDGRIAVWDAAFNVGRADQAMSVGDLLR